MISLVKYEFLQTGAVLLELVMSSMLASIMSSMLASIMSSMLASIMSSMLASIMASMLASIMASTHDLGTLSSPWRASACRASCSGLIMISCHGEQAISP